MAHSQNKSLLPLLTKSLFICQRYFQAPIFTSFYFLENLWIQARSPKPSPPDWISSLAAPQTYSCRDHRNLTAAASRQHNHTIPKGAHFIPLLCAVKQNIHKTPKFNNFQRYKIRKTMVFIFFEKNFSNNIYITNCCYGMFKYFSLSMLFLSEFIISSNTEYLQMSFV